MIRDADETISAGVEATIAALDLTDADTAAVQLARHYAALIDAQEDPKLVAWALRWIGPLLLAALESLGATPVARDRLKKGGGGPAPENQLAKFRATRRNPA